MSVNVDVFEYYKKLATELHTGDLILLRTLGSTVDDEITLHSGSDTIETYILKWREPEEDNLVERDTEYCRDSPHLYALGEILKPYRFSGEWNKQLAFVPVGNYNPKTGLTNWSPHRAPEDLAVGQKAVFAALDKYGLTEFKKLLSKKLTTAKKI